MDHHTPGPDGSPRLTAPRTDGPHPPKRSGDDKNMQDVRARLLKMILENEQNRKA